MPTYRVHFNVDPESPDNGERVRVVEARSQLDAKVIVHTGYDDVEFYSVEEIEK